MEDRHDPMLTYAMTALAANKQARLAGARATFGRVAVEPNGTNAIPSQVTAWLDARAADDDDAGVVARGNHPAGDRARRAGRYDARGDRRSRCRRWSTSRPACGTAWSRYWTVRRCSRPAPGHDAGVFSAAGIPTAMLFVRNPTGISHSPAEYAEMDDCLAGVEALAAVLKDLRRSDVVLVSSGRSLPTGRRRRACWSTVDDGRFTVGRGRRGRRATRSGCAGSSLPGLANCHSHAFHRALRGRTQTERGTFWTWREQMYAVASMLDPGELLRSSRGPCTARWCWPGSPRSASSTTCITHRAARRYDDPNAMGTALIAAARDAGHADRACWTRVTSPAGSTSR